MDAMAFEDKKNGIVISDPINNKIFVAATQDGGESWTETDRLQFPNTMEGEAFFAASGTNLEFANGQYYLVSGGTVSRFFFDKKAKILPTLQGGKMTGANGIAIHGKHIIIAGGDYEHQNRKDSALVYSTNGGATWQIPEEMTGGYRSGVCFASETIAVACGITGVDISYNAGRTWKKISSEEFNSCAWSKKMNSVFFVGNNGRLGKLKL